MTALHATAHAVPRPARIAKHAVFSLLPGQIGLRNRACYHHLVKRPVMDRFERALNSLRPGDICIDCGANRGLYTEKFAARGARTHAFEPDPWSFARLSERMAADPGDIHLRNAAVGTKAGHITFYRDAGFDDAPRKASLASSIYPRADRPQQAIDVETVDFLAFLRGLDRDIAIIKMDIEGAEVPLLEALFASDLMDRIGYLFVETHELQFPDLLVRTWALRAQARRIKGPVIDLDWH